MNEFCMECTGSEKEVKNCDDYYCPFYKFRMANMEWQEEKKIYGYIQQRLEETYRSIG